EFRSGGYRSSQLLVAFRRFDEPEIPNIARKGDLRGLNTESVLEFASQVFLCEDISRADQLENLSLAKVLVHRFQRFRRASASPSACATDSGPVPPGSSRVRMPSPGFR